MDHLKIKITVIGVILPLRFQGHALGSGFARLVPISPHSGQFPLAAVTLLVLLTQPCYPSEGRAWCSLSWPSV